MKSLLSASFAVLACMCLVLSVNPHVNDELDAEVAKAQDEIVLRIGFMEGVDCLNPVVGQTDTSRFFYGLVYDSMFSYDEDLGVVGNLATSWSIVPETDPDMVASGEPYGSVWEYHLTTNAVWHDGEPFTAYDAAWVINLNAVEFDVMWAYQPYAYFMNYAEVVDDHTMRIHFYDRSTGEPMPVSHGDTICIPMIPRHLLSSVDPFDIAFTWSGVFEGSDPPIVGTGPFVATADIYDEYLGQNMITLLRNPSHHWTVDTGEGIQFDKLVMYFYDDAFAMEVALKSGQIDIAQFPPAEYTEIKDEVMAGDLDLIEVFDGPKATQYWTSVGFNMAQTGPNCARLDPCVRQALAMATDKQTIVDTFYMGLADVGSTIISSVNEEWHYEPTAEERFDYDVEAAAQLLNDSGYVYTDSSPDIRVATEDSYAFQEGLVALDTPLVFDMVVRIEHPEEREIASYLKNAWEDIGVAVNYRVLSEIRWFFEYVYSYSYDLAIMWWSSDPDPNRMLFCQSSYAWNGWSDTMYSNATYDEFYDSSVSVMDDELRREYVAECQLVHYLDIGHLVLAYPYQTYAWRTDTFAGWGDWEAHPGRTIDAYWGVNPLLFDLSSAYAVDLVPYEREGRFNMLVPESWTLLEDVLIEDTEFDLSLKGPVYGGFQTNILLDSEKVRGIEETREYLEQQMDDALAELSGMGISVNVMGTQTYWEGANYSALRFVIKWVSTPITQDMTLYADAESGRGWVLTCSVHSDWYGLYVAAFGDIATSLDVVEGSDMSVLVYVAIGVGIAAAAAAVMIAVYVMRPRKAATPGPQQPSQAAMAPGVCPSCGAQIPAGAAFCPSCGSLKR